mgnify:CR=1 FL=1|tara:strand:+ start:6247 stop:6942 length:696 start_codon:yes stop_codon:yes gene_type:complete
MHLFQRDFIQLAIDADALCFGRFTLKSGRESPYFFNAGKFDSGQALAILGKCYAAKIVASGLSFDMLFGPAYKGIPLVAVTAAALAIDHGINIPYAFNRKEAKDHGEGGNIVGAELLGKVLIVDDVMTAGTAIREVLSLLNDFEDACAAGVVIGLDRCEKTNAGLSASQSFSTDFQIPVLSIVTIEDLLQFFTGDEAGAEGLISAETLSKMKAYWENYGAPTMDVHQKPIA